MRAEFVNAHGVRTRVLTAGEGDKVLLLIHGLGGSADMWIRVIDALAEEFSVVALDMLGHGFTEWRTGDGLHPEARLAEHVAAVMEVLGHRVYAVAGSSLGGSIAAHLYRRHPERLSVLVLVATDALFTPTHTLQPTVLHQAAANAATAMTNPTWEGCERRLRNICVATDAPLRDVALMQVTIYANSDCWLAYRALCDELLASITAGSAAVSPEEIRLPTLVLCGRQDVRAQIDLIRANYRRIEGAQLEEFDRCGHLPHLEHPARFATVLRNFISSAIAHHPRQVV